MYYCPSCSVKKYSLSKYLRHLQYFHENEPNFSVRCGLDNGCPNVYKKISSFKVHIFRKHKSVKRNLDEEHKLQYEIEDVEEDCDEIVHTELLSDKLSHFTENVQKHFGLFCLKLQEKHIIPKTVTQSISQEVKSLIELFNEQYRALLKTCLQEEHTELERRSDLKVLIEDNLFGKCFEHVTSDYQFERYCIKEFGLVQPVEYILGTDQSGKKDTFQYIPILEVLSHILNRKEVFFFVQEKRVSDGAALTDFTDGSFFKKKQALLGCNESDKLLTLQLYTDEFEILNTLGSKKLIHKIACFYFVVGNLPLKYRSQLKNIHVAVLVRNKLLQKYGYEPILQPLICDLIELQLKGISVSVDDQTHVFKGVLFSISADNLSAHSLAGFNTCFSHGFICRFCMCHHDKMHNAIDEASCIRRTSDDHKSHLAVENSKSLYGVAGHCPFEKIPHFEVTESFPPDLMHDVLEGVIPHVTRLVLKKLNSDKLITIQQLNERLQEFPFGQNDVTHKPVFLRQTVLQGSGIQGKAVEKLVLFRLLPFLIGNFVPKRNTHWDLYLLLRSVCDILLAPVIKTSWLSPLTALITDFLTSFQRSFPDDFIPKIHYLVHYPRLIENFGPLRAHWCLRYEAKHLYFKRLSSVVNNYQNIAKTLAKRYQMRQCWESQSSTTNSEVVPDNVTKIPLRALPAPLMEIVASDSANLAESVWKAKQLEHDRVQYKVGDFYILDLLHAEEIPVFLKLIYIIKFHEEWKLCGRIYQSSHYSEHLHAYGVKSTTHWMVVNPGEEVDYHPLDCYADEKDDLYITLHHRPVRNNLILSKRHLH
ncbi:uncharacterized protein LOC111192620 isoform X1 [Astyanax mexicanus]|uniref:uncharacterized protein LOC111192620 isoform X1 n=1 Tax=Astyanax mexicanus TaxID=7994 RepID=UPI0020CAA0CC|nr:uncharacterized protein LOC111192620 isoform X1 [Astyanax mexicanus]